jgi:nucleotide-binding universal stress UspA family protein
MASNLFPRIMVPTDFSACSEEAWALAKRVAVSLGSEVVLAHVFVEPIVYGDPSSAADTSWQLFENDVQIHTATLASSGGGHQGEVFRVSGKTYGAYGYRVVLAGRRSEPLQQAINDTRTTARGDLTGRRQGIADWMQRHLDYIMHPPNEWTAVRSVAFMHHLAWSPGAAFINLTQIPMVAVPYLSSRFGNLKIIPAFMKAGRDLRKMYDDPLNSRLPQDESDALDEGKTQGFLDQAQATAIVEEQIDRHLVFGEEQPMDGLDRARLVPRGPELRRDAERRHIPECRAVLGHGHRPGRPHSTAQRPFQT